MALALASLFAFTLLSLGAATPHGARAAHEGSAISLFTTATGHSFTMVAHHKSGTYCAVALMGACCCPQQADEEWWNTWKVCTEACADVDVSMCNNGLHGTNTSRCEHDAAALNVSFGRQVVNFVRHPIDVAVSGYLYHRGCHEEANQPPAYGKLFVDSEEAAAEVRRLLGAGASNNKSYCELLQANHASVGVEAELVRSMGSTNGIADMLRDFETLEHARHNGTATVQQVCLATVTPGQDDAEKYWADITGPLGCNSVDLSVQENTREAHGTSSANVGATHEELRQFATDALKARFSEHESAITEQIAEMCPVEEVTASTPKARLLSLSSGWETDDPFAEVVHFDRWS